MHTSSTIGILSGLQFEINPLEEQMSDKQEVQILGIRFTTGEVEGKKVVLASTSNGKVNSAIVATLLVEHFKPGIVLFAGTAGGLHSTLLPGDVVICEKTVIHDFGIWTVNGFEAWETWNPVWRDDSDYLPVSIPANAELLRVADSAALSLALEPAREAGGDQAPKILKGTLATGDAFIASATMQDQLREKFQVDAIELGVAAAIQVCWWQAIPHLVVRGISTFGRGTNAPGKGEDYHADYLPEFHQYAHVAAQNAAHLTVAVLSQLDMAKSF